MENNLWKRLARPAVFVEIISAIRSYALIILYFAYRAYNRAEEISIFNSFDLFLDFLFNVIPAFLVIISGVMEYRKFKYQLTEDYMMIHRGWIRREKKSIPIDKIQSVQVEQNWLYRMLNIYLVKVDTIGESDVEVEVGGVRKEEAFQLKQRVQTLKSQIREEDPEMAAKEEEEDVYRYELTNKQITRYAVTENLLWVFLPIVLTGILIYRLYAMTDLSQFNFALIFQLLFGDYDAIDVEGGKADVTISYVLLYMLLIGSFSSSLIFFNRILGLFKYKLIMRTSEIFIQRGLINKFETIIPKRKIQYITWYTNLIRRRLGIYTLNYKYAGSRRTLGADAIVPFFDEGMLPELISPYHKVDFLKRGENNMEGGDEANMRYNNSISSYLGQPTQIDKSYIARNFIFVKLPLSLALIILSYWVHPYLFYFSFLIPVYFIFHNIWFARNFHIWLLPEYIIIKKGVWGRRHFIVKWEKLQKLTLLRTPYQRRSNLSNLILCTASSNIFIPYIPLDTAEEIKDYGLYKTERSITFLF